MVVVGVGPAGLYAALLLKPVAKSIRHAHCSALLHRKAAAQSTYSVLSAVNQNSRSSASDLNVGTAFRARDDFRILSSLLPIQVSRGQHANQWSSHREHHEQPTARYGEPLRIAAASP